MELFSDNRLCRLNTDKSDAFASQEARGIRELYGHTSKAVTGPSTKSVQNPRVSTPSEQAMDVCWHPCVHKEPQKDQNGVEGAVRF